MVEHLLTDKPQVIPPEKEMLALLRMIIEQNEIIVRSICTPVVYKPHTRDGILNCSS